jgi:tripartite-type tricarboxylate transporter receptor subunit TctC
VQEALVRRSERIVLRTILPLAVCVFAGVSAAIAQTWPAKPIRMLFGFAAGGAGDISARMLAQKLSEALGQNVVVENRPGAGGAIADDAVAKSAPDGYTLLYAAGSSAILPSIRAKLPYDIERDFAPVSLVVITSFTLAVHPSVPVRDVQALIALAKSQPGKLTFSSPGVGSSAHFAAEFFNMMAGLKILHVPYKGAGEATTAAVAGEIDMVFPSVTGVLPLAAAGKLKALGVTSAKRAPLLPDLPTLDEAGVSGYERLGWNGVLVPAAASKDVVARLNTAILQVVNTPQMTEAFVKQGLEVRTTTPDAFAAFIRREMAQNAKLAKFAGIRAE